MLISAYHGPGLISGHIMWDYGGWSGMVKSFFKYCGFRLSVSFQIQAYEAWKPSKKAMLFQISENIQQISTSTFTLCLFLTVKS